MGWMERFGSSGLLAKKARSGAPQLSGCGIPPFKKRRVGRPAVPHYYLSSLASATWDWCPASATAFTKASALAGVVTLPERMLRNIMR
jgi:hypothetical protein